MKITLKKDVLHVDKPEGTSVDYYLFNEYEIHYNEQKPGTSQTWHHHEKIWEALFILEGELAAEWKENGETVVQVVSSGDLIETERTAHSFTNNTHKTAKFLVFKFMPHGKNFKDALKTDKVLD